ncbi:thioredoxin domain-containing protein [Persicobacter diffluens]|uniref:Thioredoxin n=1 Tax=Persicobacter diffluens TaxID=981 RepID=A0AAN4W127_9BACT|nr:thioredoxin [Persicobacter diffluens]
MPLRSFLFLLLVVATACQPGSSQSVSVEELHQNINQQELQLLDVRTPNETASGIIKGAQVIDFKSGKVVEKAEKIFKKDAPLYVYCHSGGRSARAVKELQKAGFQKVINVEGGISAWKKKDYPVKTKANAFEINQHEVEAFQKALKKNDISVVNFYATWCGSCKKNKPFLEGLSKNYNQIVFQHLDVDQEKSIYKSLSLQSVPVILIYKGDQIIRQYDGLLEQASFEQELKTLI